MLRASKVNQIKSGNPETKENKTNNKVSKNRIFCANFGQSVIKILKNFTDHKLDKIRNFNDFVEFMYEPVDAASIGVGRMLFGALMLIDIPEERGGSELSERWSSTQKCHFPLIPTLQPMNVNRMASIYALMWIGALGISLGYKFRISSIIFTICYWYIFLLDLSMWNNHSYLYGLCGILFMFSNAHNYCSIDAYLAPKSHPNTVPFWNYFLLKFQFFIMYFVAGLKKFSAEWLSGYAMLNLSHHWIFFPFRMILGPELTDLVIIHWFTCFFDMTVAFCLVYQPTRKIATLFCIAFHLINSRLFAIGMFPWVCLAELPLFYSKSWPRAVGSKFRKFLKRNRTEIPASSIESKTSERAINDHLEKKRIKNRPKLVIAGMLLYCGIQIALPYSHFITNGFNNWTDGVYGYSWDMMIHAWDTVLVSIKVAENDGCKETHYLNPEAFTKSDRWTKHAYLAHQYVNCIHKNLREDYLRNVDTILSSANLSIYLDIWCSMNGRFQQRIFDPTVDIVQAKWSPFQRTTWTKPLLQEFSSWRPQMLQIAREVLQWNNYTDVMFIADFPGLKMDSFISSDLDNVTLTVLDGQIDFYKTDDGEHVKNIKKGQTIPIVSGKFHHIRTIGETPSCYMYIFVNRTMQYLMENASIELIDEDMTVKPLLPLWSELQNRFENYGKFFNELNEHIFKYFSFRLDSWYLI